MKTMASKIVAVLFLSVALASAVHAENTPFVRIEGGSYLMGIEKGENNPSHQVKVSAFLLSPYVVTIGEWAEYLRATEQKEFFYWARMLNDANGPQYPETDEKAFALFDPNAAMYCVSWEDTIRYCNWRSARDGLKPVYAITENKSALQVSWDRKANGYRLPTEAEWEYAARGAAKGIEGRWWEQENILDHAWIRANTQKALATGQVVYIDGKFGSRRVGTKKPNPLGLYDMIGNVGEWCFDFYDIDYYRHSPRADPIGPKIGRDSKDAEPPVAPNLLRVGRGLSWDSEKMTLLGVFVFRWSGDAQTTGAVGFRLARNADETAK
jgi:Uncharacterized conserved protein